MVSTCWTSSSFMVRGWANVYKLAVQTCILKKIDWTRHHNNRPTVTKTFFLTENATLAWFSPEVSILIGYKNTFSTVCSVKRALLDSGNGSTLVNVGKRGWPECFKAPDPPSLLSYVNACPHPCANALPFVQETCVSIFKGNAGNKSTLNELRAEDPSTYKSPATQHWSAQDHHLLSFHTSFMADCRFILTSFYL